MDTGAIDAIFIILSSLGGVAAIIGASGWARAERIRAERAASAATSSTVPDADVVSELRAIRAQMAEMHSTSHQFDLSFDEALSRLEGRVSRIETKPAAGSAANVEASQPLRNGH